MTEASVRGIELVDDRNDPLFVAALGAAGIFGEATQSAEMYCQQTAVMTYEEWFSRLAIYNSAVRTGSIHCVEPVIEGRAVVGYARLLSTVNLLLDTRPSEDTDRDNIDTPLTSLTNESIVYVAPTPADGEKLLRRAFDVTNESLDAKGGAKLVQTVIGLVQLFRDGNTRMAAIERVRRTHDYDGSAQAKALFSAIEGGRQGIRQAGLAVNAGKLLRKYADRLVQAAVQDKNYEGVLPRQLQPYVLADLQKKRSLDIDPHLAAMTTTVIADRESGLQIATAYLLSKDRLEGYLKWRDANVEFNSAGFFDTVNEEECAEICHWHDRFKHTFIAQLIASFTGKPNELGDWERLAKAVVAE